MPYAGSPANNSAAQYQNDEIDLHKLIGQILDHKWKVVAVVLASLVLGSLYALLATPIYRADALLQLEKKQGGLPGFEELSKLFEQESPVAGEVEILTSRLVLGEAVDALGMTVQLRRSSWPLIGRFTAPAPTTQPGPLYGALVDSVTDIRVHEFVVPPHLEGETFELRRDGDGYVLTLEGELILQGRQSQPATSEDGAVRLTLAAFAMRQDDVVEVVKHPRISRINWVRNGLSVAESGRGSGILRASYVGPSPRHNRAILNAIADAYLLQNIRRTSAQAEKSLEFLDDQLPDIRESLEQAENRLNQFRLESGSVDLTVETQQLLSRLVSLEAAKNELMLQEKELSALYTAEHPTYRTLLDQQKAITSEMDKISDQVRELPETQQQVLRLARDVQVNQEIYVQMLNRSQELRVARAGTVGNVRIIDRAETGSEPIKPNRPMIIVLSLMLGLMAGVGGVLFYGAMRRGIETPAQLEDIGIPVYAAVPLSDRQQKTSAQARRSGRSESATTVLAQDDPSDLAVESLRSLRTSLHFAMADVQHQVLMLTGPSPNIGKSFIASNFAVVQAQVNKRVLVVDCDMRKGYLHHAFGLGAELGLSHLLSGVADLAAVTQSTSVANLDFIGRGRTPPNPAELLMSARFDDFIKQVRSAYDIVILDTPPILAVTDAAIVGRYASITLLVARFDRTPVHEVEVARRYFKQNGVEIKGAILNCMEPRASNMYGYYPYRYAEDAREENGKN